jgi:ketosteroid isomerase-like protein
MRRLLSALALVTFLVTSAAGSEKDAVMSIVRQWIDALNKGDMESFAALCTEDATILDDFPPYQWQEPDACSHWSSDASKDTEITDLFVTLGKPLQIYVTSDHAYVVTRDSATFKMKGKPMKQTGSIHTFVLHKSSPGWRISGEAWADTAPATPRKRGS